MRWQFVGRHPRRRGSAAATDLPRPAANNREGGLLVLVTHQVTISALSGTFAESGTGVLMARGKGGQLEPIGTFALGVVAE